LACNEYSGQFHPYENHELISIINNRVAESVACHSSLAWQTLSFTNAEDYRRFFAQKVVSRGASDAVWGVLEVDPGIIEAALQIAVAENRISTSQLPNLRQKAQRQFFKKGARTFLLMHNQEQLWAVSAPEPELISQRSGSGRLVGMSVGIGLGMKRGDMGMLMFEDKVCEEDTSYAIRIQFVRANNVKELSTWAWQETGQFVFGGESNILGVLSSVYKPYVPEPTQTQTYSVGNIQLSSQDMLAIGSFALDIVAFLLKVL